MDLTRLEDGWKIDEYVIGFSVIILLHSVIVYFIFWLFSFLLWKLYDRKNCLEGVLGCVEGKVES